MTAASSENNVSGLSADIALSMKNVAVERGGRTIWSGADFDVPTGSFTAIIGPNGAGKSTTAGLVLGQIPPSNGTITVLGAPPARGNERIGLVPQNHTLDQAGSIVCRDVVGLGLIGTKWGASIRTRSIAADVDKVLAEVDATRFAYKRFGEVSGGQQQRVTIAQALIINPDMLVLDEPLAGLDLQGQVEIVELVHRINRERGVTVLFVTHDLNPLLAHIDSLIYILDGRPFFGKPDDVVNAGLLTRLYSTPVQVLRTDEGCIFTRTE